MRSSKSGYNPILLIIALRKTLTSGDNCWWVGEGLYTSGLYLYGLFGDMVSFCMLILSPLRRKSDRTCNFDLCEIWGIFRCRLFGSLFLFLKARIRSKTSVISGFLVCAVTELRNLG